MPFKVNPLRINNMPSLKVISKAILRTIYDQFVDNGELVAYQPLHTYVSAKVDFEPKHKYLCERLEKNAKSKGHR